MINCRQYKYIALIALLFGAVAVNAQNLDPTVTVTKDYVGHTAQAIKPELKMSVPDSLKNFDLTVDYSVFENPYKGAYEFNPYLMDIRPQSDWTPGSQFYMKAGIGYLLKPVFDFVWSPVMRQNRFHLNVYGSYDAYVGNYRNLHLHGNEYTWKKEDGHWKGYDMETRLGVEGRYDWEKNYLTFRTDYWGIHTAETMPISADFDGNIEENKYRHSTFNSGSLFLKVASKDNVDRKLAYEFTTSYRLGSTNSGNTIEYTPGKSGNYEMHDFLITGDVHKNYGKKGGFKIGGLYNLFYVPEVGEKSNFILLSAKYFLRRDKLILDAGIALEFPVGFLAQIIYPDVSVRYSPFGDTFNIDFSIKGGSFYHSYTDMLTRNHHFTHLYSRKRDFIEEQAIDRICTPYGATDMISSFNLGFDGNFGHGFHYGVKGGYEIYKDYLAYGLVELRGAGELKGFAPILRYVRTNNVYAGAEFGWSDGAWDVGAAFDYSYFHRKNDNVMHNSVFLPSKYAAEMHLRYNWRGRISAGISSVYNSSSEAYVTRLEGYNYKPSVEIADKVALPYYVDLGLDFRYSFNPHVSLWLEGRNLLNMTIQKVPVYAEPAINFTVGVSLNF